MIGATAVAGRQRDWKERRARDSERLSPLRCAISVRLAATSRSTVTVKLAGFDTARGLPAPTRFPPRGDISSPVAWVL